MTRDYFHIKTDNIRLSSNVYIRFKIVVTSNCPVFAVFASVGLKFSATDKFCVFNYLVNVIEHCYLFGAFVWIARELSSNFSGNGDVIVRTIKGDSFYFYASNSSAPSEYVLKSSLKTFGCSSAVSVCKKLIVKTICLRKVLIAYCYNILCRITYLNRCFTAVWIFNRCGFANRYFVVVSGGVFFCLFFRLCYFEFLCRLFRLFRRDVFHHRLNGVKVPGLCAA